MAGHRLVQRGAGRRPTARARDEHRSVAAPCANTNADVRARGRDNGASADGCACASTTEARRAAADDIVACAGSDADRCGAARSAAAICDARAASTASVTEIRRVAGVDAAERAGQTAVAADAAACALESGCAAACGTRESGATASAAAARDADGGVEAHVIAVAARHGSAIVFGVA